VTAYEGPEQGRDVSRYVGVELHETAELRVEGHAPAAPHLRGAHGGVRAGALLTMLDNVGGLCGGLAALPDGWVVSTNLAARTFRTAHTGPLRIDAEVLRRGRNNVVTGVQIRDEGAGDALVTDGVLTSAILVPENGPPQWTRPLVLVPGELPPEPLPPIPEWLDVQVVDSTTIEIALVDALRNPWGILHGGVVASLIDVAAEHATGGIVTDVVVHFLAPNRVGPVRAEVRILGARTDRTICRIEVRDAGADRVTAVAIATAQAPHSDESRLPGTDAG
jgi:acyl-coenzyme A thioesterase PaaI-like protein